MPFEKTMYGNPTGEDPQKAKKNDRRGEAYQRMGGIDFGGSIGEMMSNIPKETPEEKRARQAETRKNEEALMAEFRNKIQSQPATERPKANPNWRREVMIGQAITPEQIAQFQAEQAAKKAQEDATRKAQEAEQNSLWSRVKGIFGRS